MNVEMGLLWTEFSESTTVHGLRFVNSSRSIKRRIFWLVLVLAGLAFFSFQLFKSVKKYFEFKVNTVVYVSNDGNTKFPAITICNQNALKRSKLNANIRDPIISKLLQRTLQYNNFSKFTNTSSSLKDARITGQQLRKLYTNYGHTLEKIDQGGMLEFCRTPDNQPCSAEDFVRTLTYSGLCYTINSGKNGSDGKTKKDIHSAISGRYAAMKLLLSAQVDEYSEAVGRSNSAGIRVMIHDQRDPPFADTHGINFGPGMAASIAIKKQKIKSLEYPYESLCTNKDLAPGYPYSRLGCLRKCQEEFVIAKCGCKFPIDTITIGTGIPMCDMERTFQCAIKSATEEFQKEKHLCDCPFACESIDYISTISHSQYPSEIEGKHLAVRILTKKKKNITAEAIEAEIAATRKNKIYLEIFYHQLDYLTMQQVPAVTPVGIFGEIGGLLGISLGASFLTIMEILDFIFFFVGDKISKQRTNKTKIVNDGAVMADSAI